VQNYLIDHYSSCIDFPTSCSLPMKHLFGKLIIDFQLYCDVMKINKIISKFMHKAISLYLTNSSWHWGPYGSLWTGMSPTKYYMDRSKLPFGPKCHELFAILYSIVANLFYVIVYLRPKTNSDKIRKKTLYW